MKTYLHMGDNFIHNVKTPTNIDQPTNKGYVDSAITADYQKKANIDMNNNGIINLPLPTGNNQPTTKAFTDLKYLHLDGSVAMANNLQWTDEIHGGNSFNITKIDNLPPTKGNFHTYNHKVLYLTIMKNSQNTYKYEMGINLYTLEAGDYTLCVEILNTEYFLWYKTVISVDELTSAGITNPTFSVKKFRYNYKDEKIIPEQFTATD